MNRWSSPDGIFPTVSTAHDFALQSIAGPWRQMAHPQQAWRDTI
jgi:hypothetical protein